MDKYNWTQIDQIYKTLSPEQLAKAEYDIAHTGKIILPDFRIAIGVLFALSSLCFFGRITIRLLSRHRLLLDDGFLIFSYVSLVAATGIFYAQARLVYLSIAILREDLIMSIIAGHEVDGLLSYRGISFAYIVFLWTMIFMVKMSYFALFYTLLRLMPKALHVYYWITMIVTLMSWIFMVLAQIIICPYFGEKSFQCVPNLPVSNAVLSFIYWVGCVLDVLTDLAIVSIPIIILRKSQMSLSNKAGFGVFLCLSIVMIASSITRAAGMYYGNSNSIDTPWQVFWLHAQGCIGVAMASITVYRSVLVGSRSSGSSIQRFWDRLGRRHQSGKIPESDTNVTNDSHHGGGFLNLKIPRATITGLGTLFGRGGGGGGSRMQSNLRTVDTNFTMADTDYHVNLRDLAPPPMPEAAHMTAHSQNDALSQPLSIGMAK